MTCTHIHVHILYQAYIGINVCKNKWNQRNSKQTYILKKHDMPELYHKIKDHRPCRERDIKANIKVASN